MYNENDYLRIMDQIMEFGKNSYQLQITGLCMMIDQLSAKYKIPAMDIVGLISEAVSQVNEEHGPYVPEYLDELHN